jgi:hypothetical protein
MLYHATMRLDLTDDETAALGQLLRTTIENGRYPLSRGWHHEGRSWRSSNRRNLGLNYRHR